MSVLEAVAEGVWTATHPLRFLGVETGTRMTVVRLDSGELLVHSPIPLSAVRDQVEPLGPVAFIVAPSLFHHLFVKEWKASFPEVMLACCPGLEKKSPLTRFVALLLGNTKPGATWLERLMVKERAAGRDQVDRMLAWKPERILLAHGDCIETDAVAVLRQAYAWL